MTIQDIVRACGGVYYGSDAEKMTEVSGLTQDSRRVEKGCVFLATRGERADGHSFIRGAFEMGAVCAVGEDGPKAYPEPYIRVEDSFLALKQIAAFYREQLPVRVIGVTGSVGKTSTKEFIASVLSKRYVTLKTEGNYNNEVGLPLTVMRLKKEHEAAVLEMGISDFGEMHRLSQIAKPDICVLTNIGQCHLENLKSRDGILKAKTEIFDYMKEEGRVCLNGDDDKLAGIRNVKGRRPVTFGKGPENDIYADHIESRGLFGLEADIHTPEGSFHAVIPLPGGHMVYNALAATAVGLLMEVPLSGIREGIERVEPVGGRSHIIRSGGRVIIDDCYNANPVSMRAAIDLLMSADNHKTAILGDMFELGGNERELHADIGEYAVKRGVDTILMAGTLSRSMYDRAVAVSEELGVHCELKYYPGREELAEDLRKRELKDMTVLVKASHGMNFSKIVKMLADG